MGNGIANGINIPPQHKIGHLLDNIICPQTHNTFVAFHYTKNHNHFDTMLATKMFKTDTKCNNGNLIDTLDKMQDLSTGGHLNTLVLKKYSSAQNKLTLEKTYS